MLSAGKASWLRNEEACNAYEEMHSMYEEMHSMYEVRSPHTTMCIIVLCPTCHDVGVVRVHVSAPQLPRPHLRSPQWGRDTREHMR